MDHDSYCGLSPASHPPKLINNISEWRLAEVRADGGFVKGYKF